MTDQEYMQRAIHLAKKARGFTNPNPMVGAVIVKDGRIIGEGYHRKCGELHAERNAFAALTESAEGATIYVTLGPSAVPSFSSSCRASSKVAALKPKASLPFWLPAMDWKIRSQGAPSRTAFIWAVTWASTQIWVGICQCSLIS